MKVLKMFGIIIGLISTMLAFVLFIEIAVWIYISAGSNSGAFLGAVICIAIVLIMGFYYKSFFYSKEELSEIFPQKYVKKVNNILIISCLSILCVVFFHSKDIKYNEDKKSKTIDTVVFETGHYSGLFYDNIIENIYKQVPVRVNNQPAVCKISVFDLIKYSFFTDMVNKEYDYNYNTTDDIIKLFDGISLLQSYVKDNGNYDTFHNAEHEIRAMTIFIFRNFGLNPRVACK